MKHEHLTLVTLSFLIAVGVYCHQNRPVMAAVKTTPAITEAVVVLEQTMVRPALPADICSIPLEQAIAYTPSPESLAEVARIEKVCEREEKLAALESMEPEELADVYCRYIRSDNKSLREGPALTIACAYATEEMKYGFPRGLLAAITLRESRQQNDAVSSEGAYGLMQVQVPTAFDAAKRLGFIKVSAKAKDWPKYRKWLITKLKDPSFNIKIGANVLDHYLKLNNNKLKAALHQYSHGATHYSDRIFARMHTIQARIME